ncbi:MAG: DUF4402 domain-containing protein [Proteobacteria bacterium]|nr:DUF4402 domain-containing protein [Pseudomonadota bacterium]
MKKFARFAAGALVISGPILTASAANATLTATATASATLVTQVAVARTADLNFGSIGIPSSGTGYVTIVPGASATRSASGGASTVGSTFAQASFNVTGYASSAVTLALNGGTNTVTLTDGAAHSLTATLSMDAATSSNLSAGGSLAVNVGGTLNVPTAATAATYSTTFTVSASYQ